MIVGTQQEPFAGNVVLASLIRDSGYRKAYVAERAGIRRDALSHLLRGSRELTPYYAYRLAPVLGVPIEALLPPRGGA